MREEAAARDAVRYAAAFQEGHRDGAAAGAAGGAAVRPFRHAAARDRAHHAAGARRLHYRLAQCARRAADRRPLRLRRICRTPDQVSRSDRPGRARARGLPALRRRALGRGADGAGRQSGAAAQHDADGRPDRLPGQSDQGQRARQQARHRLVRADADRVGADALSRRVPPRLSGLRSARRVHEHEHRAACESAQGALRESGQRRDSKRRRPPRPSTTNISPCSILPPNSIWKRCG